MIPSEYEILQLAAAMSTTKQQQDNILTGDHKGEVKQLVSTIAPTIPSHIANPVLGNKPQPVSFRSEFQLYSLLQSVDFISLLLNWYYARIP